MNKDFDKELKEMASKSKVKESDKLKESVSKTCKNLKRKKKPVRKWIATVAASIACVLALGICFPTYAENIPVIKQAINFLNGRFELDGYESNSTEVIYSVKAGEYTVNIEDVYYDGIEISVFYNITGENPLDKSSKYWLEADIEFDESILVGVELGGGSGDGALINDNTYAGMATFYLEPYKGGVIPEVFDAMLDINNIKRINVNKDSNPTSVLVESEPMVLALDSSNIIINEYAINKEIEFEDVKININSAKKSPTGLFLNRPGITTMPVNNNLDYILWDSKKGELESIASHIEEDGTMTMQYRLPSEDGDVSIIPYVNSAYGGFNSESYRTENNLLENGKKYDFGDYGTTEIIDIVNEGHETLMKVRTTGYQSRAYFNLINDKEYSYFKPAYEKDKKVLGILDMEVTYVFDKLDPNENYYIRVPVDDEETDFKVLTDDMIKLELN